MFLHPVLKTVLERLGLGLATLFVVSIIIFSAIELFLDSRQPRKLSRPSAANWAWISLPICGIYTGWEMLSKEILAPRFQAEIPEVLVREHDRLLT